MGVERYAQAVMEWADILGSLSEVPENLTRRFATAAMRKANEAVAAWMRSAGMTVRVDNIGNLIGRYEAGGAGAKTLLLGSHLDTVRDAGKYDGALGVLVALACVQRLHDRGERMPFAIEIIGFADEEGVRYHTAYLGSTVIAGTFNPTYLELRDADGIAMCEAVTRFGGDPDRLAGDRREGADLLGYLEVHIEQGPVLETRDLPVGVVTAIQGQSRLALSFSGKAGHAGTVPMALRRDALSAAAEFVLAAEALARQTAGLVATIGQLEVRPGASNIIPGQVALSLDLRHQDDAVRTLACEQLHTQAAAGAAMREVGLDWQLVQEHSAVRCSPELSELLGQAVSALGYPVERLPSGAGHDAAIMASLTPIAMLFVRCKGGISHNPAESVALGDVAAAVEVVDQFWTLLGANCELLRSDHSGRDARHVGGDLAG